jgi:2-polyprenyl-6-methoxyphenol hydroxylase-like FAD-dependent oxidoreductase
VLFSYRADDIDAQFTGRPADRVRAAYGPQPPGRLLGEALDALDATDDFLFDSVEQTRIDTWSRGRVVLVGDSAWCVGLYSGMGASAGLAGADLLGTMLERHPGDITAALRAWEDRLRPYIDAYQESGTDRRHFVTPANRLQVALRPVMARSARLPLIGHVAQRIEASRRTNRARQVDIAYVP